MRLRVFDIAGREVARLVDGSRPAGRHVATWDGRESGLATGVYVVSFETPQGVFKKRLTLLR